MAAAQACHLRKNINTRPLLAKTAQKISLVSKPLAQDRPLDKDIEKMCAAIRYSDFFRL
jgi:histidine ammonia-lyase